MDIPKIIYMTDKELKYITIYSDNWKKLNPEYEIKLFDNTMCENFLLENYSQLHLDIFKFIPDGPIKADFWRVCVLYKYGGVYVDADVEPIIPLKDYIVKDVHFVTCLSTHGGLNPHFIMAKPNEKILSICINIYIKLYEYKQQYRYWGWSICKVMSSVLQINSKESGVYIINNMKYQFLKEIWDKQDDWNIHCTYNNIRVINNRYKKYVNHQFVD